MKIRPEILIEAAVCSFAGLMIYILSLLIPIFIFIIPVPFIVLYVKRGPVWGILASLLACLLILLSSEMETAAILLIYTVFISHTLGFMIRQNTKASNIILWSTVGTAFFILLAGFFAQSFNEMNVVESLRETINQYASSQLSMINSMNISAGDKESLEAVMKTVAEYTMVLLPGILLMISGILSYANYYISAKVLRKLGIGIIDIPGVSGFRLPKHVIIGTVFTAVLLYILQRMDFGFSKELMLNAYLIFSFLFMVNGIAALDSIIKNKVNVYLRILLPLIILLVLGMGIAYAVFGLLDLCFDLRDRLRRVR